MLILLMEEIPNNQLISSLIIRVYPIIYKVLYIQPLVGNGISEPSTISMEFIRANPFVAFSQHPAPTPLAGMTCTAPPDIGGSSQVDGYVTDNHGDRKSPKDRVSLVQNGGCNPLD